MVEIELKAPICDHTHKIKANEDGEDIVVTVETTCSQIKTLIGEKMVLTKREAMGITNNSPLNEMRKDSESQCFVPPAIATACGIASGRISKRLAQNVGNTQMEIKNEE
ncbi:hypothetical protein AMET1_1159 [Methanonatronarchaeum thermophilum]|uniref:Uncharacterized protein n=1 Tax=Methanonatronarchaeum thermophilum TaxID=1927129 RepID=A0A1Y3GD60_9EURY|nr:hypothetical protein [Methanonatronarchaeum thermophilum]OUJ18253.1 hypothetical protein AMET1_1159 [Methanonatronarchaeum thermophilum]